MEDQNEKISEAISELESLYRESLAEGNYIAALGCRKEIHRLQRLDKPPDDNADAEFESLSLELIRKHLEPFVDAPPDTPVEELARLAALMLTEAFERKHAKKRPELTPRDDEEEEPDELDHGSGNFAASADHESGAEGEGKERPGILPENVLSDEVQEAVRKTPQSVHRQRRVHRHQRW